MTSRTVTVNTFTTLIVVMTMHALIAVGLLVVIVFVLIVLVDTVISIIQTQMRGNIHLQAAAGGVLSSGGLPQDLPASLLSLLLLLLLSS